MCDKQLVFYFNFQAYWILVSYYKITIYDSKWTTIFIQLFIYNINWDNYIYHDLDDNYTYSFIYHEIKFTVYIYTI